MKIVVTGAAGFIGSHLCQKLLKAGYSVVGIDNFLPNYPRAMKEENLKHLTGAKHFTFIEGDLAILNLKSCLRRTSIIFHLAGQPGVRDSWGSKFLSYSRNNLEATQRLLEASTSHPLDLFVYASTSSVYGYEGKLDGPLSEDLPLHPFSPYGITKLAAEQLCSAYFRNLGLPTVALRFFSVYGPRQRPDMGFHQMILSVLQGKPIKLHAGDQRRDFTYVGDIVDGSFSTVTAQRDSILGKAINLGGGRVTALSEAIGTIEALTQHTASIKELPNPYGNVLVTWADISRAKALLGYQPRTDLENGLAEEVTWIKSIYHI